MLASQSPERIEDACINLRLTTELVNDFLAQDGQPLKAALVVALRDRSTEPQ